MNENPENLLSKPKTKIVATIGPASCRKSILKKIANFASVIRINLAHGDLEEHKKYLDLIKSVRDDLSILADLAGPKMRVGAINPVTLKRNERVILYSENTFYKCKHKCKDKLVCIPVEFPNFDRVVEKGGYIYLCDGIVKLVVEEKGDGYVVCRVLCGGTVTSRRGINVPGRIKVKVPTEEDKRALNFINEEKIDAVGVSFVGSKEEVLEVKRLTDAFVISKIEREVAVKNINEILKVSDGIMVARGDLGVEMPIEELAILQKRLIMKANLASKPVITATQMLESMVADVRPTRAEVTDVANAILDGSDAVMLSEETAIGKYPVEAVSTMASIALFTETYREEFSENRVLKAVRERCGKLKTKADAIALAIVEMLKCINAKYIIARTRSGATARSISRFKPEQWILAFTTSNKVCRELSFSYGVAPFVLEDRSDKSVVSFLRSNGFEGTVVVTEEVRIKEEEVVGTNALKIFEL